jgi:lipopolysaccharide export system protein LptC
MPEAAMPAVFVPDRTALQRWALPRGRHDVFIKFARVVLPMIIGVLVVALVAAPLVKTREVSFVLAKDTVALAQERLRVTAALYRGEDSKGQPFNIRAGSAVQVSSKDPVVRMKDLRAEIIQSEGPAMIAANAGRYDMDREIVSIDGPVQFSTADGYKLSTRDVAIGLKSRRIASGGPVSGSMPLGSFSAGKITGDLASRTIVLEGRAHLHIVQGAIR